MRRPKRTREREKERQRENEERRDSFFLFLLPGEARCVGRGISLFFFCLCLCLCCVLLLLFFKGKQGACRIQWAVQLMVVALAMTHKPTNPLHGTVNCRHQDHEWATPLFFAGVSLSSPFSFLLFFLALDLDDDFVLCFMSVNRSDGTKGERESRRMKELSSVRSSWWGLGDVSNCLGEVRYENTQRFLCSGTNYIPKDPTTMLKMKMLSQKESERESELSVSRSPFNDDDDTRSMTISRNVDKRDPALDGSAPTKTSQHETEQEEGQKERDRRKTTHALQQKIRMQEGGVWNRDWD